MTVPEMQDWTASRLKPVIQEIQRRSLWQVLGIYLGGALVVLQGIDPCRTGEKRKETTGRFYLEERRTFLTGVDTSQNAA